MEKEKEMLSTLRLLPDDVVLAMASRDIEPERAFTCVCGWAARELHSKLEGTDADNNSGTMYIAGYLTDKLGGSWWDINGAYGDAANLEALENAFTDRVVEIVESV